jgi:UDP-N-acetyl-2-amino-2-deoxyglucuronate dehydrogenase
MDIGLIGCGRISRRHIEAVSATNGANILAVCDVLDGRTDQAISLIAGANGTHGEQVHAVTDFRRLDARSLDAVSICTPSGMHPVHSTQVAETTDIPIVVVEKPVSLTVREAVEMFRRVDAAGKRLLPVYQNRYNPLIQFVRGLVKDGSLGTIHQFNCNIFWNRDDEYFQNDWHGTRDLDGGVLYTQASHYVDMLLYLFGPVAEAKGLGGRLRGLDVQDSISAVLEHENGAVGALNCTVSTYRKNYQTEFTVIGSKGTVRLQGTNLNTISFWDVEGMEKPDMDFTIDHIYGKGHDFMYQYIVEERWDMFPTRDEVLAGIELMERLSF